MVDYNGAIAYKQGAMAGECPFAEGTPDFYRWNDEWDAAADEAMLPQPTTETIVGSVVTNRYRALYTEMGHPTHCGDELATFLNNVCQNKAGTNLEIFEAICAANGVDLSRYNRTKKGWQGRLRMTGRNLLAKVIVKQHGVLHMPEGMGDDKRMPNEWLINARTKFRPKEIP